MKTSSFRRTFQSSLGPGLEPGLSLGAAWQSLGEAAKNNDVWSHPRLCCHSCRVRLERWDVFSPQMIGVCSQGWQSLPWKDLSGIGNGGRGQGGLICTISLLFCLIYCHMHISSWWKLSWQGASPRHRAQVTGRSWSRALQPPGPWGWGGLGHPLALPSLLERRGHWCPGRLSDRWRDQLKAGVGLVGASMLLSAVSLPLLDRLPLLLSSLPCRSALRAFLSPSRFVVLETQTAHPRKHGSGSLNWGRFLVLSWICLVCFRPLSLSK